MRFFDRFWPLLSVFAATFAQEETDVPIGEQCNGVGW
jgi:hypothetical protein